MSGAEVRGEERSGAKTEDRTGPKMRGTISQCGGVLEYSTAQRDMFRKPKGRYLTQRLAKSALCAGRAALSNSRPSAASSSAALRAISSICLALLSSP